MAITTHESADVGVCITNRLSSSESLLLLPELLAMRHKGKWRRSYTDTLTLIGARSGEHKRIIELDVDIGADAMDYK